MMHSPACAEEALCCQSRSTGKERDSETGLDYFGARYYGSNMGRFLSPDEPFMDQTESDPQSWNLYTYVRNNPVRNTDPTGNGCVDGKTDNNVPGESCEQVDENNKKAKPSVTVTATPPELDVLGEAYRRGGAITRPQFWVAWTGGAATVGALGAGGVAAYEAYTGATVLTTLGPLAPLIPIVPSALEKLQKLGLTLEQAREIVASPASQRLVDNLNSGNINVIQNMGDKVVRVTLDPTGQRIISAGLMRANQVANGIASGRFTPTK